MSTPEEMPYISITRTKFWDVDLSRSAIFLMGDIPLWYMDKQKNKSSQTQLNSEIIYIITAKCGCD